METNFWICRNFAKKNNFPDSNLIQQAYEQNVLKDENNKLLIKFINFLNNKKKNQIHSQLYQDIFAEFILEKNKNKIFLEFGATDGLNISNSYSLENFFGWTGLLVEPDPQWHNKLKLNRPNTKIIYDCIWTKSNEELNFISSQQGELSTLESFKFSDKDSMPNNSKIRNQNINKIKVKTISLDDLIEIELNKKKPSYISVDTEGSEYEILKHFNFDLYGPEVFTIEHNHTNLEKKIDDLLHLNNYKRVFRKLSAFDAWYVKKEILKSF